MSATFISLCLIAILTIIIYIVSTWKFNYWRKKKVPHLKPIPLFGNYKDYILMKEMLGKLAQRIGQAFPDAPYVGTYFGTEPALLIQDPELIRLITTKDFQYFYGREICRYTHKELITQNLFFNQGEQWKVMRHSMSPLFTSSKLRSMFPLVQRAARGLDAMLARALADPSIEIDAYDLITRFTMDSICSCGFGIETNTMADLDKENPFCKIGEKIFDKSNSRGYNFAARAIWPAIFYGLGRSVYPTAIVNFFKDILDGVFESRKYKPSNRNDFVDMVLKMKDEEVLVEPMLPTEGSDNKVPVTIDNKFMVSQCIVFFAAGYETSATTTNFTLFELAKDLKSQKRVHEEVDRYFEKHNGELEYDCTTELPFLDACIDETMRLYPVLALLTREVMADYTLPDGLLLEKGLRVHLPVYHLHRHPEFFPEPDQFRPERFLPENKQNIKPYTYMPFGEGPRICIGMRVGKMQTLAGLATVLRKYSVQLPPGASTEVDYDAASQVTSPKGKFQFKLVPRQ